MLKPILTLFLLTFSLSALAIKATVISDSPLQQSPSIQSSVLTTLSSGTQVETIKRSGGWKLVKTIEQQPKSGWIRSYRVRQGSITINKETKSGGFFSGLASLSRRASGLFSSKKKGYSFQSTATIGVRGLSEEEIKNAKPDMEQLSLLDSYKVTKKTATIFSQNGRLKPIKLAHLPKSKVEK